MHPVGSLWEKTAVSGDGLSEEAEDADCDVAIVGAGFTGLRAALCLAEKGVRVVVLEARDVGWGASATLWNFGSAMDSGTLDPGELDLRRLKICFIVDAEECPAKNGTEFVRNEQSQNLNRRRQ